MPGWADVDWDAVDGRLPVGQDPESRAARKALFKRLDYNGNGDLSLTEAQSALPALLESHSSFKSKNKTKPPLVPVSDFRPAIKGAYAITKELLHEGKRCKTRSTLKPKEFHAFLISFRYLLELDVCFGDIDTSGDRRVNYRECKAASGLLENWNITDEVILQKFGKKSMDLNGGLRFDDFAEWAITYHVGQLDLKIDDDEAPASTASQDAAQPDTEVAPPTEMAGAAAANTEASVCEAPCADAGIEEAPSPAEVEPPPVEEQVAVTSEEANNPTSPDASADVSSWIQELKLQYTRYAVGDRIEGYQDTLECWHPGTVEEVLPDNRYLIAWDPIDTMEIASDREKGTSQLRRLVEADEGDIEADKEDPAVDVPAPEPEPSEPAVEASADPKDGLRDLAGVTIDASPLEILKQQRNVETAFQNWDKDDSGGISLEELSAVLTMLNPEISSDVASSMFESADFNKDGIIDYKEFVAWLFK